MKKTISLSVVFLLFILVTVSFIPKKPIRNSFKSRNIVECLPIQNTNRNFISQRNPTTLNTRRDFTILDANDKAQIILAISVMKSRISTDPTSWDFQVNLHKKGCQHGNCYFLAWHRMYIYYFERILQSCMDPSKNKPALPFWNYQNNRKMPSEFYTNSLLINPSRNTSTLNTNYKLPKSINIAYNKALGKTDFYKFQKKMENAHDGVHQAFGGDMVTTISPNDAIFWLHHANVDMQWEMWRNKKYGRCNPTQKDDPTWWAQPFTFYNEKGNPETLTCGQILSTSSSILGYEYENVSATGSTSTCNRKYFNCPSNSILPKAIIIYPNTNITSYKTSINYSVAEHLKFDSALAKYGNSNFDFSDKINSDRVVLSFEDIVSNKYPNGVVEVYIYRKNKTRFDATDESFVGFLPLFSAATLAAHEKHGESGGLEIELNDVLQRLKVKPKYFKNLKMTFIVRGNSINEIEQPVEVDIRIGKTMLSLHKN
jgi:Common central domain of tyrosinase/Polyphenol oxidase middle domain